ncbi:MAG: hypothetical protein LBV17_02210 [Treponema sp.]|jgi:membrane protein CcdC involved in cytochrome C biogenesis|nr:hypothetical protein [Treponema sp.]
MKTEKFDERQLQIRGDVFKHGFLTAGALMLFNAFLQDMGVEWANGFHQNILMLILIITVVSIEFHLRGVYFGRGSRRNAFMVIFGLCSIVLLVLSVIHYAQGKKFVVGYRLTDNGFYIAGGLMFLISTICALVQFFREKKAD